MLAVQTQRMCTRGTPDSSEEPQSIGGRVASIKVPGSGESRAEGLDAPPECAIP